MRIVVLGSGIAGLSVALRASARHDVVLATKGALGGGSTAWAQGGIAAAVDDADVAAHYRDTMVASAGLADPDAVLALCSEGPRRVAELVALGVPFDRDGTGLARGREAAHSRRRILHADGDATGAAISRTLVAAVRRAPVQVIEDAFLDEVLAVDGRASGVRLLLDGEEVALHADAVVIATGGWGALYPHTTNPPGATGDGVAAAWRAGAALVDLEFVQFHPTALAVPGRPLVSEAVRGEGATLIDERGRRFLVDTHPDGELAPRDVVARAIAAHRAGGHEVFLDATRVAGLARRFPGLTTVCLEHGFEWTREPVPVTPAAHYAMGGIATDLHGRSTLPGLYAVGEAARTGVHGANRLASNSLLEGLVFAARAAEALDSADPWRGPAVEREHLPAAGTVPIRRHDLAAIAWDHLGLERDAAGLRTAIARLDAACVVGSTVSDRETRNLLDLARLTARAALRRERSLGAHHRRDEAPHPASEPRPLEVAAC